MEGAFNLRTINSQTTSSSARHLIQHRAFQASAKRPVVKPFILADIGEGT